MTDDGSVGGERKMATVDATVELMGMPLTAVRGEDVVNRLFADLAVGRGGWLVTVNLDILRRHHRDPSARALYAEADLRVADGMPLVWASRVQRPDGLPERVAGATLATTLAERAATEGRSLYLLGGAPGAATGAATALRARHPALRIAGASSPRIGTPPTSAQVQSLADELCETPPDLLLVGLGSPKQEHLIRALRPLLPATWMIGVGVTFSFMAGQVRRAPVWAQRAGLEWAHRMAQEPRRLARRYLIDDIPFAAALFSNALVRRLRG